MTIDSKKSGPRRAFLAGGLALLGLGVAGGLFHEWPIIFGLHYPPTPYDDLLSRLPDRESAIRLGAAVLSAERSFDAHDTAVQLRARLKSEPLAEVLEAELRSGFLVEVHGWVLPNSLVKLCALAAKAG
ncbi:MAG TPA: hypothetical protein VII49_01490 [Rhizomicrobium sp.]